MNSSLSKQYSIVLEAIEDEEPVSYLALLKSVSNVGADKFSDKHSGYSPYPLDDLISDLLSEGFVSRKSQYLLTDKGRSMLKKTTSEAA